MATINDVARLAGVSITTVSHVINNTRFVSDELKERVVTAMHELDYRPNTLAQGLRKGTTKTIGLIIPDNSNLFFAEIARSIEDVGYENGYSVILCNTDNNLEKQRRYTEVLVSKQVDGIILISAGESAEDLEETQVAGIPVVVADREIEQTMVDVVLVDNEKGGYLATKYLLELGHRRISCIAGPSLLTPSAQRVQGYQRALQEANIAPNSGYLATGDFGMESGESAIRKLLDTQPRTTAVFVCNDMMAVGAMRGAREFGLRVPEDLSIIGFDNILLARATTPPLTTVAQPKSTLARVTTELLIKRIHAANDNGERRQIVLAPELVIRESCCAWSGD
jgi:LacI family transcriptional regulator